MNEHKEYVFIMGHPRSGTTLLWKVIGSSPNTSLLPMEGLKLAQNVIPPKVFHKRWSPEVSMDFKKLKKEWGKHWDPGKKIHVEKSPPSILRCKEISRHFDPLYFIWTVRNPYAFVSSVKQRFPKSSSFFITRFWCVMVRFILEGHNEFRSKSIFIKYEDFVSDPEKWSGKLMAMIPELKNLDIHGFYMIKNRCSQIQNLNDEYIKKLSEFDIGMINKVLRRNVHLIDLLGYKLIETNDINPLRAYREIALNYCTGHHAKLLRNYNLYKLDIK